MTAEFEHELKIEPYQPKYHREVLQFGLDIPYKQNFYSASWRNPISLMSRTVIFSAVFAVSGFNFLALGLFSAFYEIFLYIYTYYSWADTYAK